MNIQWFPGHMTKALRMMEENVKAVDAIGYVLDARAPSACFNPQFRSIIGEKPCVFILNKCDLADSVKTEKWCSYFKNGDTPYVKVTATASAEAKKITAEFEHATAVLREKYRAKGICRSVRFMILGVPNCGKSTLINCLAGRKSVITGDKPGVTKGKQWVRLQSGLELLDTPGTLWPKFDSDDVAVRLCCIGSIKDDVVDIVELANAFVDQLRDLYPDVTEKRYGISCKSISSHDFIHELALKRGYLLRGGEADAERCAKALLDDFRKGKLGCITLDLPPA